ncbi:MAG: peptidylprolyl isomerase, partial [Oscillospiraceae bacterium]|nr:peptidylprolyl isomerase [Oscillospiraceae bacterium]
MECRMFRNNPVLKKTVTVMLIAAIAVSAVMTVISVLNKPQAEIDMETVVFVQKQPDAANAETAVIETSCGTIKAVLYPEYAPKVTENFKSLANSGYYDGTYVYEIDRGHWFSAGTPNENGDLNPDFDKKNESVKATAHQNLWPFKGALCAVPTSEDKSKAGSRFMFLNTTDFDAQTKEEMLKVPGGEKLAETFFELGGIPNLSQQICVFGQVFEGMD